MGLAEAIDGVIDIIAGVSGIKSAPSSPPETLNIFPIAIVVPSAGTWEFGPVGEKKGLHNIVVMVHVARKDLPKDVASSRGFGDTIADALMSDPTLGGTVSTFERISYEFGDMEWGGVLTLGWRFVIQNVKIRSAIT